MKKLLILVSLFLLGLTGCNEEEKFVDGDETVNGSLEISYSFSRDDIVNPYTANHKVVFFKASYGVFPAAEINVIDLNGESKLPFTGGFVALYGNEIDVRLYLKSDSSEVMLQYPGNGVYKRR
jgi:hypothetical protein